MPDCLPLCSLFSIGLIFTYLVELEDRAEFVPFKKTYNPGSPFTWGGAPHAQTLLIEMLS